MPADSSEVLRAVISSARGTAESLLHLLLPFKHRVDDLPSSSYFGSERCNHHRENEPKICLPSSYGEGHMNDFISTFHKAWRTDGAKSLQMVLAESRKYKTKLNTGLRLRVDTLYNQSSSPSLEFALDFSDQIKSKLYFREEGHRFDAVAEAHHGTFGWILEDEESRLSPPESGAGNMPNEFRTWLEHGKQCFWINGKAGSGKSTFMKYIYQHPLLYSLLKSWAKERQLIVCPFFFWYAGNSLQSSHEGILRSLLFHILDERPSLTPVVFPRISRYVLCKGNIDDIQIDKRELHQAMLLLAKNVPNDVAIFLFVDGIDEYTGDHFDFSRFLVQIVKSSSIKMLVSSRPIPACYQTFSNFPSLTLQDLTIGDIRAYIEQELMANQLFVEMDRLEPGFAQEIESSLLGKSSGVFLWVILVVRSLLIGLGHYENKRRLMRMIDELPTDLSELYDHMFLNMSKEHQSEGSLLFQLVIRAKERLYSILTPLQLHSAFQFGLDGEVRPVTTPSSLASEELILKAIDGKLRSRCCGLVEVQHATHEPVVDFFHRTVYDYLRDPEVWNKVIKFHRLAACEIDLMLLVGGSHQVQQKSLTLLKDPSQYTASPSKVFTDCLQLSYDLDGSEDDRYLDQLEAANLKFIESGAQTISGHSVYFYAIHKFMGFKGYDDLFLRLAVSEPFDVAISQAAFAGGFAIVGIPAFFAKKVQMNPVCPADHSSLMLRLMSIIVLSSGESSSLRRVFQHVETLLDHDVDPTVRAPAFPEEWMPQLDAKHTAWKFYKSRSLSPWEFWCVEQRQGPLYAKLTLRLLRTGAHKKYKSKKHMLALEQLLKETKEYKIRSRHDVQAEKTLCEIIQMLESLSKRSRLKMMLSFKNHNNT